MNADRRFDWGEMSMMQAQRPDDGARLRLITAADVALGVSEMGHAVLARVVRPAAADRLADPLAKFATRIRPAKRRWLTQLYRDMLGKHAPFMPEAEVYVPSLIATLLRQRMIYSRLAVDPAWRPNVFVEGATAVEAARRDGRGIVLWMLPQEVTALVMRMVCHDRGWGLHHLSHWHHGQSVSRLGIATFNRRDRRIEDRLGSRLMLTETDTTTALSQADRILGDGGTVGFRGIGWAQRPIYYPLFDGSMHLGLGAPVIARRSGAALFIVSTVQTDDGYCLWFDPIANNRERPLDEVGQDFAARLERAVVAAPFLWSVTSRQWAPGAPPVPFGKRQRV